MSNRKPLNFDYIKNQATGRWLDLIFPAVGIQLKGNGKKHQPCPICGGKDRFRCDNKHGTGSWICNNCEAGNGFDLVQKYIRSDAYGAFERVAGVLGIDGGTAISEHDRQKWLQAQFAREQMEQEQRQQQQEQVAETAKQRFDNATPCTDHLYLAKKGVPSYGLKIDDKGNLLIPLYAHDTDTGDITLCNIQSINETGDKYFMKDGQVKGSFFTIGEVSHGTGTILICEGYATGASLTMAVGGAYPVIVSFNAHNMKSSAPIIRALYPNHRLIFCADNDLATAKNTGNNVGVQSAQTSANSVNGEWIVPHFDDQDQAIDNGWTDYNDLHEHFGLEAVTTQLMAILNKKPQASKSNETAKPKKQPPMPATSEQLKATLKQYAKIIDNGKMTNKIYDTEGKMQYTKTQFEHKVGKAVAKEWFMHETKTIEQTEVDNNRRTQSDSGINGLLDRYALIFGTKEMWDNQLNTRFSTESIRLVYPNEFDVWLKSPSRNTIYPHNIWFDPSGDKRPADIANPVKGKHYINSFNGLATEPLTESELGGQSAEEIAAPILNLLFHLCERDWDNYQWVMRWLAIPLQQLGTKMDTALIFHGHIQGAGKSLFFDQVMTAIYGQYAVTLGQGQLEAEYNEWVVDKMYAIFEEIFSGKDRYANMGKVKQLITSKTLYISKKYSNGWIQDNFVNMVFLSNDIMPLSLEQGDRRFMVLNPNTKIQDDIRQAVSDALTDPTQKVIRAFLAVLMTCDLGEQNANTHPPMTRAKQRLIGVSMPSWERFFIAWKNGETPVQYGTALSHELYRLYKMYCQRHGDTAVGENKFATYLTAQPDISKQRLWYANPKARKQGTFIIVGEIGVTAGSREKWLWQRAYDFDREWTTSDWFNQALHQDETPAPIATY